MDGSVRGSIDLIIPETEPVCQEFGRIFWGKMTRSYRNVLKIAGPFAVMELWRPFAPLGGERVKDRPLRMIGRYPAHFLASLGERQGLCRLIPPQPSRYRRGLSVEINELKGYRTDHVGSMRSV